MPSGGSRVISTNGGSSASQRGCRCGQRGANRQPVKRLSSARPGIRSGSAISSRRADGKRRRRQLQAARVRMPRRAEDLLGRSDFDRHARVKHHDLVANMGGKPQIMGDEDDRGAVAPGHFLHDLHDARLHDDVERRRRLVGNHQFGLSGERHGDKHALAHAAGQLMRILRKQCRQASANEPHRAVRSPAPRASIAATPRRVRCSSNCWPMVSTGLSAVSGSCGTKAIGRRASRAGASRKCRPATRRRSQAIRR